MRDSCIGTPHSGRLYLADLIIIDWELIKSLMYNLLVIFLIFASETCFKLLQILFSNDSLSNQLLRVKFISRRMVFDCLIHKWLGKGRLILLVMSISPVTYDINEDVFLELLPIGDCNFHAFIEDVRLISIDMDYGGINSFSDLSAVEG